MAEKNSISPVKAMQLYELVAERLREKILEGVLKPGERLPAERELAAGLGVGRATLREAIGALNNEGLLNTRPNSGTYVVGTISNITSTGVVLKKDQKVDTSPMMLLECRMAFEPVIAEFAARSAQRDPTIEGLLKEMDCIASLVDQPQRELWNETNRLFHRQIAVMTRIPLLTGIADLFASVMSEPLWRRLQDDGIYEMERVKLYVAEHRLIYEAISNGDVEASAFYVRKHLERVQRDISLMDY
jgi:DNA-binding FadR family transcriptional regulator